MILMTLCVFIIIILHRFGPMQQFKYSSRCHVVGVVSSHLHHITSSTIMCFSKYRGETNQGTGAWGIPNQKTNSKHASAKNN